MIYHKFKKYERLSHKKYITALFTKGKRLRLTLVKFCYLPSSKNNDEVIFIVPKKLVKKAVERNRIKRRMREAYRLHKYRLGEGGKHFLIGYIYIGHRYKEPSYTHMSKDIKKSIAYLQKTQKEHV